MNWNRETLKGDFLLANSWFKDNREKVFCIGLWLEMRSGFYDNSKKKKYYTKPDQSLPSTSTSIPRPNIHGSKIILCMNLAIPLRAIDIGYNWFVWAVHCKKNIRPEYEQRHIKLFFFMTTLSLMSLKS